MRKERGAFLMVFCLVLTVLLLSSLAVLEISNHRSEAEHARHYTKLAALEALKAYQESREKNENPSGTGDIDENEKKWEEFAAKSATDFLDTIDANHQVFKDWIKNKKSGKQHEDILPSSSNASMDNDMVLELGYWVNCKNESEQVLEMCQGNGEDDIVKSNQGFLAAKEYRKRISVGYGNSNAVRICGKWLQDSKSYIIERLLSGSSNRIAPKVCATAMIIPRHVYFLVDITDSGDDDTFGDKGTDYVMCNQKKDTCYSGDDDSFELAKLGGARTNTKTDKIYQADYVRKVTFGDDDYEDLDDADKAIHPCPKNCPAGYKYPEDEKYSLLENTGSSGGWMADNKPRNAFLVHAYNDPAKLGRPLPEPLTTIVNGVNDALMSMKKRRVTGDKAGLIFFTNGLVWPRITTLTDDFDALMKLTDYVGTGNTNFENIMKDDPAGTLTQTSRELVANAANGLERAIRFSILPIPAYLRDNAGTSVPDSWSYTNIAEAVGEAMKFINRDEGVNDGESLDPNIYRSIVLFSDGLPNCYWYEPSKNKGRYICFSNIYNKADNKEVAPYFPKNSAAWYHNQGIAKLNEIVFQGKKNGDVYDTSNTLQQKGITFNVFHVGASVGPHTLMIKKPDGSCYTDAEYRTAKEVQAEFPFFVKGGGGFYTKSSLKPFYKAAENMYKLARQTKGLYIPLRGVDSKLCAKTNPCVQSKTCDYSCLPNKASGTRITTDPYCRSLSKQVSDGIDEILSVNPFRLVDVDDFVTEEVS